MRCLSVAVPVLMIWCGVGCQGERPVEVDAVTFSRHIGPIVLQKCASCHHEGEVAPFALLTYADVARRAEQIREVTVSGFMPPWKSVLGHGKFVGERRLNQAELALIARWVEQGMPEGDPRELPQAPKYAHDWKLGKPDLTITLDEPFAVPAEGPDIYHHWVFDVTIPAGKYLKAVEYRPSNRRVVHHAALAIDTDGSARQLDEAEPGVGFGGGLAIVGRLLPGSLGAWTPGREPMPLPEGFSFPWQPGAGLVLQVHLHPSGKPEVEQSSIGLYLTDDPPQRSMIDTFLHYLDLDIPPGDAAYKARDEMTLPCEVDVVGLFPHMHILGREVKVTAHPPAGQPPISMLWIDDWDFNWQIYYQYETPLRLPAGTKLVYEAMYDNSEKNFRNPNKPPRRVVWGDGTTDEMALVLIQLVPVHEEDCEKLLQDPDRVAGSILAARAATTPPKGAGTPDGESAPKAYSE